jgi:hypothetical protein
MYVFEVHKRPPSRNPIIRIKSFNMYIFPHKISRA